MVKLKNRIYTIHIQIIVNLIHLVTKDQANHDNIDIDLSNNFSDLNTYEIA